MPNARAFLLARIADLSPGERRLIETTEPTFAHANSAVYYHTWRDESGAARFVVEGYGPQNVSKARRVGPMPAATPYARPADGR